MRSLFTILGAGGTIGGALTQALRAQGRDVQPIGRDALAGFLAARRPAGHVIDCIGMTGDFRSRPLDTAEAHVGITARCLAEIDFRSFLFLSSTRVYAHAGTTQEDGALACRPGDPSDLYNLTKLAGEALCLADARSVVRVVRLSNVYAPDPGPDTFLGQVLAAGRANGGVVFRQAAGSEKDYVSLDDVVRILPRIAVDGRDRLYNLASGRNTTHGQIAAALRAEFRWDARFEPAAPVVRFPPIDVARLAAEFGAPLRNILEDLATLSSGQEVPCSRSTRQAVA
ncbi:MAG: NAD-dependent epimerase/dehydratase family protein [Acetobacteraceae bacterium]